MKKLSIKTQILSILTFASVIAFFSVQKPERFACLEFEVRVINGFTNNSSLPLVIWCTAEGGELGGRALQEGDDFSWNFKTNFWGTTHYLCTMKWEERRRKFDAFKFPRDIYRCSLFRKCSWLVTEDGFYFSNDEINWKKDFSWF
ncbi:S-protein homolog 24-like [Euphorbia lathyris]|uniref:S-protein homolog 24-like n=1 Tax=Euphorbia lathyris TaxID=212925 RepID=UPI0033142794